MIRLPLSFGQQACERPQAKYHIGRHEGHGPALEAEGGSPAQLPTPESTADGGAGTKRPAPGPRAPFKKAKGLGVGRMEPDRSSFV